MAVALSDSAEVAFSAMIQWSPDSKRLFMQIGWHGESHIASIAATGGQINFHTSGPLMHSMGNIAGNGKPRMALAIGDGLTLSEVHIGEVSPASIQTNKLSSLNDKLLSQLQLSKPESHWIKSADGNEVQVWSIKPIEFKSGKKYPAILEIHGGPHAMYGGGFFHEFQLLAANGYAVFFSNPRGSKGYGRDHCAAIRGSWGGADWVDIQAVTNFMKKQSFVDPKRMGVMGGSYGGYMTNWVIGHTTDFKAAITDRCVSNLVSLLGTSDYVEPPDQYWPGNTWNRPEKLWDMSPLKYLGDAKAPTQSIHSEGDLRCNVEQAEQVFTALKLNNVPTRFVRYPACTSHGLSRGGPPDLRVHRLNQILDWWKKWLA
jgi:dipeptidyl aminopeptidase/acylaminoacyl peptidase